MDKFLYSENNLNTQTKRLIKLLNININDDPKTIQMVKRCKNIVSNTIIEVYNKYGDQLEPNMINVEKLNNKCLSNCIKKIKNSSNDLNNYNEQQMMQQNQLYSHPEQMINPSQNLEPFSSGSSGNFASLSTMPITGGIMNAMGSSGLIDNSNKYNGSLKKEGRNDIMKRLESLKQETSEFYRQQQPENPTQNNNIDVAAWLNLGGGSGSGSGNNNQQQSMQQIPPPSMNNQQPDNTQQASTFTSYNPGNNNMGSSFYEAYKMTTPPNAIQNQMIQETDASKRLEMLNKSRSSMDGDLNKYQNGKGFDPMKSASEYNKGLFF
jgi:hypothetical protein